MFRCEPFFNKVMQSLKGEGAKMEWGAKSDNSVESFSTDCATYNIQIKICSNDSRFSATAELIRYEEFQNTLLEHLKRVHQTVYFYSCDDIDNFNVVSPSVIAKELCAAVRLYIHWVDKILYPCREKSLTDFRRRIKRLKGDREG